MHTDFAACGHDGVPPGSLIKSSGNAMGGGDSLVPSSTRKPLSVILGSLIFDDWGSPIRPLSPLKPLGKTPGKCQTPAWFTQALVTTYINWSPAAPSFWAAWKSRMPKDCMAIPMPTL